MKPTLPYILTLLLVLICSGMNLAFRGHAHQPQPQNWWLRSNNPHKEFSQIDTALADGYTGADTLENSHLLLGNPSNAQAAVVYKNNYLIDVQHYVLSYHADRGIANWVSWHLDSTDIKRHAARQDRFRPYAALPENWYTVTSRSYTHTGFDRGHHCPSADRVHAAEANAATFFMINILPQAPKNNQQVWNNFESYLRGLVQEGHEIYIIMGSYGDGGVGRNGYSTRIDQDRIAVPARIWKIAIILPHGDRDIQRIEAGEARALAIDTPNDNDISRSWKDYQVSIRAIEHAIGYRFLSALSYSMREHLALSFEKAS